MVKGILIDTEDDRNRSPTAIPNGFFSGRASETIARNEDALLPGSSPDEAIIRPNIDRLGFVAGAGGGSGLTFGEGGAGSRDWVA